MDKYNELIKSLDELIHSIESYHSVPEKNESLLLRQTAEAIEALQTDLGDKEKLLDEALRDLAQENDCKNCAHISQCSTHRIERNLAYGGCDKWEWHGAKSVVKAS
jgi:hypothetical protein